MYLSQGGESLAMVIEGRAEWERPELIVLTRSRPEEAVLRVCKFPGSLHNEGSPQIVDTGCNNAQKFCKVCNAAGGS
jgi:hypothetical protein